MCMSRNPGECRGALLPAPVSFALVVEGGLADIADLLTSQCKADPGRSARPS